MGTVALITGALFTEVSMEEDNSALTSFAFVLFGLFVLTPLAEIIIKDKEEIKDALETAERPKSRPAPKIEMKAGCDLVMAYAVSGNTRHLDCHDKIANK